MTDSASPPLTNQQATVRGVIWMTGALFSFIAMAIAGREISYELDTFQLMFFRSLLAVIIVVSIGLVTRNGLRQFATHRLPMHVVRNLCHFVGQYGWFFAIASIPMAQVFAIEFTIPLWVALFAPLVLTERLTPVRIVTALTGFLGVLIVVRPGVVEVSEGTLAALVAALGFTWAIMLTKRLATTERALTILFYMAIVQLPLGLLPSLGNLVMPSLETWGWLVVVTCCGLSAHYCMARALALADATLILPIDFLRLPLIAVLAMLFYGERLDPWVFLGGAIILVANFWNLRAERRRSS